MSLENLLITDRQSIRKSWGKTDLDVIEDIVIIKKWLETQKHLPETPCDNMIEFFLTNCKYSIEKTKQNLDMYYTVRDLMPLIYKGVHPCKPEIEPAYKTGMICTLPKLTQDMYRITILKYNDINPDDSDIDKFCAHFLNNIYEVRLHEDLISGDIYIADYEFVKFGVMAKLSPILLKNVAQVFEKVQSNRMKALHLLNPPGYVDKIITLFKTFLPKKLQERIFIHKTIEDLCRCVPRELLPCDYGGNEKSMAEIEDLWKKKFHQYKDRFNKLENMKVDESLRPEKLENDEILGYHGNFKNIRVD
ncbi:unnamed protein product [Psylliodes chrysocephalus]|uniref:CRAL-TRIO domain-containing protein n=1 Tax=Psylliodes chrysocephalus TaxID=3402493 RepID=A0A9P0GGD7_9CUCU|nr:unnamed protein product [Psylliodes chrysocephala]